MSKAYRLFLLAGILGSFGLTNPAPARASQGEFGDRLSHQASGSHGTEFGRQGSRPPGRPPGRPPVTGSHP